MFSVLSGVGPMLGGKHYTSNSNNLSWPNLNIKGNCHMTISRRYQMDQRALLNEP